MSLNLSYSLQEVNKKIEYLSGAHDKLTAIVAAQSHIIKTLKSFHVEDFRKLAEEKNRRKQESQNSSQRTVRSNNTQQQRTQKGFDLEYEQMKQQMALLQSHLSQLTATPSQAPAPAPAPVQSQGPQPINSGDSNSAKVV
jgi:hypothetical protein